MTAALSHFDEERDFPMKEQNVKTMSTVPI
jgi:hypothetical protein